MEGRTTSSTRDAVRARQRREARTPQQVEEENRKKAEKAKRRRLEAATKEGRSYNASAKPYSPRKKMEGSYSDDQSGEDEAHEAGSSRPGVAVGAGDTEEEGNREATKTLVPWDTEMYPALNLEAGCLISEDLARELAQVGALANTWLSGCGLPQELMNVEDGKIQKFCAERMQETSAKLTTGHYVDYVATQLEEENMRRAVHAAVHLRLKIAGCIEHATPSQAGCLNAHKEHIAVLTSGLDILADCIARARSLLVTVGRTELLEVLLEEGCQSAVDKGGSLRCSKAHLAAKELKRLMSNKWLSDQIVDFLLTVYEGGHTPRDVLLLNTSFAQAHLIGKRSFTNYEGAMRYVKSSDAARTTVWEAILIPLVKDSHYVLLEVLPEWRSIWIYDSLGSSVKKTEKSAYEKASRTQRSSHILSAFVDKMCEEKGWERGEGKWSIAQAADLPQQVNGSDCGVFMLLFLRHLMFSDKINGPEIPMKYRFPPTHLQREHVGGRLVLLGDIQSGSTHVAE